MFFKHAQRNAIKYRKNNGLFFGSLVVAVIAFYTLLSLGDQDVMVFLKTIERDAVTKFMNLVSIIYVLSLFFVFFLVYFGYRYQLDHRKKEFGLYIMLGMKRSTFFALLLSETIYNSIVSLLIGLPLALLLTECISLATAKVVGLGIIGHSIGLSFPTLFGTIAGVIIVQVIAMALLVQSFSRKEPIELLASDAPEKQVQLTRKQGWMFALSGLTCLGASYVIGLTQLRHLDLGIAFVTIILGVIGTFMLYRGLGVFIGFYIQRKSSTRSGLFTFTARQIQENIFYQYKSLAVSSLLLVIALSWLSFGIGVGFATKQAQERTVDFSINGPESDIRNALESEESRAMIADYYPLFLSSMNILTDDKEQAMIEQGVASNGVRVSWKGLRETFEQLVNQDNQDERLLQNHFFSDNNMAYVISLTSYNRLLQAIGKEEVQLGKHEVAIYSAPGIIDADFIQLVNDGLQNGAHIEVDGQTYDVLSHVYRDSLVADRTITITQGLIVSDENYANWAWDATQPETWNVVLKEAVIKEQGLMQALTTMGEVLNSHGIIHAGNTLDELAQDSGVVYESYIEGIGRELFYTVSASYLTIYLGVLFMVIANTVIGLKYLMHQQANKQRYITLLLLGGTVGDLCRSASVQIRLFFALVISIAVCNAGFAIWSMFTSFLKLPEGVQSELVVFIMVIAAFMFVFVQFIYIYLVERVSKREIQGLHVSNRR
jgi:putative ABC transport system permease protein